ncbi:MAG TPA: hypothetical protein VL460_04335 [Caulobacteraceae bacterium]|jgi:hypothetical protein|nr:hypothetical protein [Caulobacteraceae bacterium]
MDGRGFTADSWARAAVFQGRCATPHDVDAGAAVFALGETLNGRPMAMAMPQPVIWYEEDEEFAALVVQAEVHETEDGETLRVLGLLLPQGHTAVGFSEDVDEVDATDPVWLSLLAAEGAGGEAEEADELWSAAEED